VKVTVERVSTFDLRGLLGFDCPEETFKLHADCLTQSTAVWLGKVDGVDACAIGVIPISIFSERAYLWMIHTKICEQHPLRFIRWSRRVLDDILLLYPTLIGLCHPDNVYGKRWLEWLGSRFVDGDIYNSHLRFRIS
jgi:hypothetical protein